MTPVDETLIKDAIVATLDAAAAAFPQVAWDNQITEFALPYLNLQIISAGTTDDTINRTKPTWTGMLNAQVVCDIDTFETDGIAMLNAFKALFPAKTRIALGDGRSLFCPDHPQPGPNYRDGMRYRLQAQIKLRTVNT